MSPDVNPPGRRGVVVGPRGMVSAGHSLAAAAALNTLQAGGNAVDAALAASGVQAVVEMPWCGLGGDLFMLVHRPGQKPLAFNGSGIAPSGLRPELIGGPKAPRFGPLSVAVPGLASVWEAVQPLATRPLGDLLQPAIQYAREGFPVYPRFEKASAKIASQRDAFPSLTSMMRDNGTRTGQVFRQPALARSLETVARHGPRAFYDGEIGESLVRHLAARGGVLSVQDLRGQTTAAEAPISTSYRGRQVLELPPVSLGCVLLQELRILDGFDLQAMGLEPGGAGLVDLLVRCKQAAFADAAALGDPRFVDNPLVWLLSEARAIEWRQRIQDAGLIAPVPVGAGRGTDTTSTVVADADGSVVCLIQSLFNELGARELDPETGILLNDRLANLAVDDARPNGLRGGRRPLHTLNAYLVLEDGAPVLAGATPGGRGQVQTNLQVLVNVLDFGMDIQAAVDAPRWVSGLPYRGENDQTIYLEPGFPPETAEGLRARGHGVEIGVEAVDQADPFGSCTVIARTPDGSYLGASDDRRGAFAIGW